MCEHLPHPRVVLDRSIRDVQPSKSFRVVIACAILRHLSYAWPRGVDVVPCLCSIVGELVGRDANDGAVLVVQFGDIPDYVTLDGGEDRW